VHKCTRHKCTSCLCPCDILTCALSCVFVSCLPLQAVSRGWLVIQSEVPFPAPPVLVGHWETVVRHLAERVVNPACKKYRRREPATFTLLRFFSLLSEPAPPFALPAICISVFHFFSPSYTRLRYNCRLFCWLSLRPAAAKPNDIPRNDVRYERVPVNTRPSSLIRCPLWFCYRQTRNNRCGPCWASGAFTMSGD
jgi:hypothetical protein